MPRNYATRYDRYVGSPGEHARRVNELYARHLRRTPTIREIHEADSMSIPELQRRLESMMPEPEVSYSYSYDPSSRPTFSYRPTSWSSTDTDSWHTVSYSGGLSTTVDSDSTGSLNLNIEDYFDDLMNKKKNLEDYFEIYKSLPKLNKTDENMVDCRRCLWKNGCELRPGNGSPRACNWYLISGKKSLREKAVKPKKKSKEIETMNVYTERRYVGGDIGYQEVQWVVEETVRSD